MPRLSAIGRGFAPLRRVLDILEHLHHLVARAQLLHDGDEALGCKVDQEGRCNGRAFLLLGQIVDLANERGFVSQNKKNKNNNNIKQQTTHNKRNVGYPVVASSHQERVRADRPDVARIGRLHPQLAQGLL